MPLHRRLIVSVFGVLIVSLLAGATLTYEHAAAKVRTEMNAALAIGIRVVQNALDDSAEQADSSRQLARIVRTFNGDRHLRALLTDQKSQIRLQSTLQQPQDPAPNIFRLLVANPEVTANIDLPPALHRDFTLQLLTDSHNEIAEAWDSVKLDLSMLGIFFLLVLALILHTLRGALRPLQELCAALTRIGAGDYTTRINWKNPKDLASVQDGFNAMAVRLADMEMQNRLLHTRIQCVQEEERADLARDLHDEVAPFLFAVSADASLIRQFAANRQLDYIETRADGILTSVSHMQKHLRHVLSRLMPDVLLDLGLAGALETLVHFWTSRCPDIEFGLHVDAGSLDHGRTAVAFRVVQESLSNAVRHAHPSKIDIRVEATEAGCVVEISDDGSGMKPESNRKGLGLLGMRERVQAIGGNFNIGQREGSAGVAIRALLLPVRESLATP